MLSAWWTPYLVYGGIAAELLCAATLLRHRRLAVWPSVIAFCLLDATATTYLAWPDRSYQTYFYGFYIVTFATPLFRLWTAFDLSRATPSFRSIAPQLMLFFAVLWGVCASIAWRTSASLGGTHQSKLVNLILTENRNVTYACGVLIAGLCASTVFVGLGWTREAWKIACGLLLLIAADMTYSSLVSLGSKSSWISADLIHGVLAIVGTLSWSVAVFGVPIRWGIHLATKLQPSRLTTSRKTV